MTVSPSDQERDLPRLHLVTEPAVLADYNFRRSAEELLHAGGPSLALHLRGPGLGGARLWELADCCVAVARRTGSMLLINDRIDVALACDADGVQLGGRSFAIGDARRLVGPRRWIGASVHAGNEATIALAEGADFLLAGTVYPTPSHPGRPGHGSAWLSELSGLGAPIIGIGGISAERAAEVLAAGAYGIAVVSGVWRADSPVTALKTYLAQME